MVARSGLGPFRKREGRLDGLEHGARLNRFEQTILDAQFANDPLKFFAFQRGLVQGCGDDQASSRKGRTKLYQIFRALIVLRDETTDH